MVESTSMQQKRKQIRESIRRPLSNNQGMEKYKCYHASRHNKERISIRCIKPYNE